MQARAGMRTRVPKKGIVAAGSIPDILLWNPVGEVYD
jgi:hypothetical protein